MPAKYSIPKHGVNLGGKIKIEENFLHQCQCLSTADIDFTSIHDLGFLIPPSRVR